MKVQVLPSLLAADYGRLAEEIRRVETSDADALHLDIMDAHFVPNLSFGPDMVALSKRVCPQLYRHVHLMMTRPDLYAGRFIDAGAQTVQIHVEADCDVWAALQAIRARGVRSGLVLRPQTSAKSLFPYLPFCDEVLFMTVNPGYGGQSFMCEVLPKIRELRRHADDHGFKALDIMVDGGINFETAVQCAEYGANQYVAGSFLFKQSDMGAAVTQMRERCERAYGTNTR
ncbi:MAG TPA: ribulose-phosphate 3-epimerase [Kiritimatiellia bacterium]|nr:ribulose-phosphate 3-epimerase [Kiritimatiellia bacterium]HPS09086.1 ribulose-phosphate 3-epimerase [Kiritimatiellia bacterium]